MHGEGGREGEKKRTKKRGKWGLLVWAESLRVSVRGQQDGGGRDSLRERNRHQIHCFHCLIQSTEREMLTGGRGGKEETERKRRRRRRNASRK